MRGNTINGSNLRKFRIEKNITQKELGEKIGVSDTMIRMLETNKRKCSDKVLNALSEFFGVSVDELEVQENDTDKVVMDILDSLIEAKIITDPHNIDTATQQVIMKAIENVIAVKLEKKKQS